MKSLIIASFPIRDKYFKYTNFLTIFPSLSVMTREKIREAIKELDKRLKTMEYSILIAVEKSASESLKLIGKSHYVIKWKGKYHARSKK